ncbi:MAG: radical SAM/Cys-rich domain protein [Pseudomonadales bacterium]|nr:radical SAM/Cys-rich domain protein [Pseudomonadales bacterium]
MRSTLTLLESTDFPEIRRTHLETLQVNLGYRCNQSCVHCHVNAGPHRTEMMDDEVLNQIVQLIGRETLLRLDLTGGAPELHPRFRDLVLHARQNGIHVINRCNLTVLQEPGQEDTAEFLADHQVEIIASLPCYNADNVDHQRGSGTFEKSIAVLKHLNQLGYGIPASGKILNLVYNPIGATLPPDQNKLEDAYRRELSENFGLQFTSLFTLTNMPIQRFGAILMAQGQFDAYMALLKTSYQASNLSNLMCRTLISVDWQGNLYDCDFNQQLGLPMSANNNESLRWHVRDLLQTDLRQRRIRVADHCYGCTAGQGSSCGGALMGGAA